MRKLQIIMFAGLLGAAPLSASAIDLKGLLGDGGSSITNVIQGVISKDDLAVEDLAGEWTSQSSAVCFKSEDFLKKAGGAAAATAIENKLNPYFEKAGLTGGVLTIQTDGNFTFKIKSLTLKGTITKGDDRDFYFQFQAFGKVPLGKITTYVTKSINSMDVMFDADGLRKLIIAVAGFSGNSSLKSAASILDSYDGLCIGFTMNKTGKVEGEKESLIDKVGSVLSGNSGSSSKTEEKAAENKNSSTSTESAKKALEQIFKSRK